MIKKDRYWKVVGIAYLLPVFFAVMDVIGYNMWIATGTPGAYAAAEMWYMRQFWYFAYLMIGLIALTYYFVTRDKSESLALIAVPFLLLRSGVEDITYFFIRGIPLSDVVMPWSMNTPWPPALVARLMGHERILGTDLGIAAVIGLGLAYLLAKWLRKVKG